MAITSQLKQKVDLPVWEWCRFLPATTTATSAICYGDGLNERYMYILISSAFYRYDTITDSYQVLAAPPTAPVTTVTLRYTSYGGYRGNIISANGSNAVIAGLENGILTGSKIRIMGGTGTGQERTINSVSDTVTYDHGVVTSAGANSIADSTKKWAINQYIGYQVRLVFGTGLSQVRKVLYNDTNTLYFYDVNYQQLECWNNVPFSATAPYALPVTTAGSQTHYYIEANTITVDSPWSSTPDVSSSFACLTGSVWALSAVAGAPWSSFQMYDVISDTWIPKTALGGLLVAALGTDFSIERTGEVAGTFITGTASSGAARTLTDSSKTMTLDRYANHQIRITGGTGFGQRRRIVTNDTTNFTVEKPWDVNPDNTSTYSIYGNTHRIYLFGNAQASIYKYDTEADLWFQGNACEFGQTPQISIKFNGQEPFAMSTGVRGTNGITAINATPVAGGTGYVIGEIITLGTGSNGKVRVTSINSGGIVASAELYAAGTGYSVATASQSSTTGSGTGLQIAVSSIGTIGRITTVQNHNLCKGESITIAGCSDSVWNTTYTIIACDSLTTFDIIITAAGNAAAATSQGSTTIVDASKTWTVNEHVGKIVSLNVAGAAPTTQVRRISSNTVNTLTVASITAAANGTSRYVIHEPQAFGRAVQFKTQNMGCSGRATGGSTTTLVDSGKTWIPGQWVGYKVRIVAGVGLGAEIAITANSATTLTFATQTFTPDTTSSYIIMDTFGLATGVTNTTNAVVTDTTKNWTTNMWAGKRLKITSGAGTGQEISITSNTATALTCSGVFGTAPDTTSTYQILAPPARSTGIGVNWIFGNSNLDTEGKYITVPRGGGSNVIDRYDITQETYDITLLMNPTSETMSTGTMYCYNGGDYLYYTINSTGRCYRLNVNTLKSEPCGVIPYAQGTALLGNRMEILMTQDGLYYLYVARHSGQEFFRTLIFW